MMAMAKRDRCRDCGKPLPDEAETDLHDHREEGPGVTELEDGRRQCLDCGKYCWRAVNGDKCVEGYGEDPDDGYGLDA